MKNQKQGIHTRRTYGCLAREQKVSKPAQILALSRSATRCSTPLISSGRCGVVMRGSASKFAEFDENSGKSAARFNNDAQRV